MGYPLIVVCGKMAMQDVPLFEFIYNNEDSGNLSNETESRENLTHLELLNKLQLFKK